MISADSDPVWFPRKGDRVSSREVTQVDGHGVAWRDHLTGHTGRCGRQTWREWAQEVLRTDTWFTRLVLEILVLSFDDLAAAEAHLLRPRYWNPLFGLGVPEEALGILRHVAELASVERHRGADEVQGEKSLILMKVRRLLSSLDSSAGPTGDPERAIAQACHLVRIEEGAWSEAPPLPVPAKEALRAGLAVLEQ